MNLVRFSVLALTAMMLAPHASAQATLILSRPSFEAATGAVSVPIPASNTLPPTLVCTSGPTNDCGCAPNTTGIGVPSSAPLVVVTAPLASGFICVFGPNSMPPSMNTDPAPVSETIIGNGDDDYVLTLNCAALSVGLELLTNLTAIHTITLTFDDATTQTFFDADLETDPNTFEFVGFQSTKEIVSILVDSTDGNLQNEGISAILIATILGSHYCTANVNSSGWPATLCASGSASVAANDLVLSAGPGPIGEPGIFYYGPNQIQAPFGDGFRCVGGPAGSVVRIFPFTAMDGASTMTSPIDNTNPVHSQISAGSTLNFQAWFRDPAAGGTGFNLSDGLAVTFTP